MELLKGEVSAAPLLEDRELVQSARCRAGCPLMRSALGSCLTGDPKWVSRAEGRADLSRKGISGMLCLLSVHPDLLVPSSSSTPQDMTSHRAAAAGSCQWEELQEVRR